MTRDPLASSHGAKKKPSIGFGGLRTQGFGFGGLRARGRSRAKIAARSNPESAERNPGAIRAFAPSTTATPRAAPQRALRD